MKITKLLIPIVCLVILALFLMGIKKAHQQMLSNFNFKIYFDNKLSPSSRAEIKKFIEDNCDGKTLHEISQIILNNFNFIKNVNLKKNNRAERTDIFLVSEMPTRELITQNSQKYIPPTKKILNKKDFIELDLPKLESEAEPNNEILNFITNLKSKIYDAYNIGIKNKNLITLTDKAEPRIKIITTTQNIPEFCILGICNNIAETKLKKINKKKRLNLDIRFKDQIVVYEES